MTFITNVSVGDAHDWSQRLAVVSNIHDGHAILRRGTSATGMEHPVEELPNHGSLSRSLGAALGAHSAAIAPMTAGRAVREDSRHADVTLGANVVPRFFGGRFEHQVEEVWPQVN